MRLQQPLGVTSDDVLLCLNAPVPSWQPVSKLLRSDNDQRERFDRLCFYLIIEAISDWHQSFIIFDCVTKPVLVFPISGRQVAAGLPGPRGLPLSSGCLFK